LVGWATRSGVTDQAERSGRDRQTHVVDAGRVSAKGKIGEDGHPMMDVVSKGGENVGGGVELVVGLQAGGLFGSGGHARHPAGPGPSLGCLDEGCEVLNLEVCSAAASCSGVSKSPGG
jgi:hypothetical protein